MSIHPDIARALIQTGGNVRDAYRIVWQASIPKHLRRHATQSSKLNTRQRQEAGKRGVETVRAQAKARRAILLPKIEKLMAVGLTGAEIARCIGIPERTARHLIRELRK